MTSLVFPGQGSQFVGMSKDFYNDYPIAKQTIEEIEDISKINLKKIVFENYNDYLNITKFTQLCIFSSSISIFNVLKDKIDLNDIKLKFILGHSLGEYTSLVASNVITLKECTELLKIRGELMQNAYEPNKSGMAAIIGLDCKAAEKIISINKVNIEIANNNSPFQVVISGKMSDLENSEKYFINNGAKKFIKLNVSAAFHSTIMKDAENKMLLNLKKIKFNEPKYPLVSNYSGMPANNANLIFDNLSKQMSNRVKWVESINFLEDSKENNIIEIGPGNVLSGLIKRISKNFITININNIKDLEDFIDGK